MLVIILHHQKQSSHQGSNIKDCKAFIDFSNFILLIVCRQLVVINNKLLDYEPEFS